MDVVTIGMLARNEAGVVGNTIASLLGQSIFDPATAGSLGIARIELRIVPNGCTDNTSEVARVALAGHDRPHVCALVCEQAESGKSRAWNTLVHELAPSDTNLFVFLDADIEIDSSTVIEQLIVALREWPETFVTTSEPLKRFPTKERSSLQRKFSVRASSQASDPNAICGQLYCGRAEALRRIWLPVATPGEDGFLCAMVKTDGFTHPPIEETVRRVPGALHYYEPDRGIAGFVKHEARLLAGTAVNIYLFEYLWEINSSKHVGVLIDQWNKEDLHWVDRVVAHRTRGRRWRLPKKLLFTRLHPLLANPLGEALRRTPVALAATLISLAPSIRANRILGRAGAAQHW